MTHPQPEAEPQPEFEAGQPHVKKPALGERVVTVLGWVGFVVTSLAFVYVLTQVPWTTTIEYSRRNGRAPLLVLLGGPLIFWLLQHPKKTAKKEKKTPRKPKRGNIFAVIAAWALTIFSILFFIFAQLYLSYEFLRAGGALG